MKILFIIGAGGFLGSIARYLVQQGVSKIIPVIFPYGTLAVNISGCFLIGLLYGLADKGSLVNTDWRVFLVTGLCGGFTTFSTFSFESYALLREEQYLYLLLYVSISVIAGIFATVFAISLMRA